MRIRALAALITFAISAFAQRGNIGGTISLKKRLHVNTLITEPGTIEVDYASAYSFSSGGLLIPTALKYTPVGHHDWWGRTEYSLAFNSSDNQALTIRTIRHSYGHLRLA